MIKKMILFIPLLCSLAFADGSISLESLLSNFHSLQANFVQISQTQGQSSQELSGTLAIEKPNRFRWEVKSPNPQLIVADGKNLWNYEEDLEQVNVSPIDQQLSNAPMLLLSGEVTQLKTLFTVQAMDAYHYQLKPKQADSLLQSVVIGFDKQDKLQSMVITNNMGQSTEIDFSKVEINPALSNSLFIFKAPAGVDVLS